MRTLLVVDDDTYVRQLVRRVVRKDFDAELLEAEHGLAALDLLLTTRVDMVMLDISMPVMDGLETLDAIRRLPQLAAIPIMILAGRAEERQVQELIRLGITGFLVKPFRPSLLRDRLNDVLIRVAPPPALPPRPRIGGLALHADSRVLLLDDNVAFSAMFEAQLATLCHVESTHTAADALAYCSRERVDAVFVGSLGTGIQSELFARKARLTTGGAAIVALASVGQCDAVEATGLYEFTMLRSFVPQIAREALRGVMTPPTVAHWALAQGGPALTVFASTSAAQLAALLGQDVLVGHDRVLPGRYVCASLEMQAHGLSWQLSLTAPYASALALAEAELGQPVDQLSDGPVARAIAAVAGRLGQALTDGCASELALEATVPVAEVSERPTSTGEGKATDQWTWNWGTADHVVVTLSMLARPDRG